LVRFYGLWFIVGWDVVPCNRVHGEAGAVGAADCVAIDQVEFFQHRLNLGCLGDGDSDVVILGALPIVAFPEEPCNVSHEVHLEFEAEGLLEGSLNVVAIREVCSPFAETW
jgi:hypothetical protein